MNPKYQIFISSTYEDLKEEREAVLRAILRMGHIPIGMELFNASNETQWQMIERRIEETDYYIVIVAHNYGSIEKASGISYTQKEYEYAKKLGVPTYGFVIDPKVPWAPEKMETETKRKAALKKFSSEVSSKMRSRWKNKEDLASEVTFALNEAMTALPRTGWVRANQAVNPETLAEMTRLSKENAEYREQVARLQGNAQNTPPMPELNVDLQVVEGDAEWYEVRKRARNDFAYGMMAPLTQSPVELKSRRGLWLQLTVANRGTLATDVTVRVQSNKPIIGQEDIDNFHIKDEGVIASLKKEWMARY